MTLDDLDLSTTVRADLERYARELDMSPDILVDHVLEAYSPAEGDDDLVGLRIGVEVLIIPHTGREVVDETGES